MCLKTRYYTNLCVHCYGDIIFWRWMQPWMFLRFREVDGERDARGRWHQSGQGLRRGILLGLRETAKSIAAGPELAFGSDSRPCRNNAVSRSPSSNHPSSAAARPDATFLWLTLPADRKTGKKPEHGMEAYIKGSRIQNTGTRSAQHTTINIVESRNQIGTAYHHKYRRSQQPNRHNVPP